MVAELERLDDRERLVREALKGDENAFEALVGPLLDPGFKLALIMLGDRAEAEDAVQESALRAWRKLHQMRGGDPRPWFLAIVTRQCITARRSRWRSVLKLGEELGWGSQKDAEPERTDLLRALRRLHPKHRSALFLHFYLDLPLAEVAQALGLSVPATKSRIHRSLQKLRPALEYDREDTLDG
jgi:RNA polymerase sigma-70 factor (ECF subfamily)